MEEGEVAESMLSARFSSEEESMDDQGDGSSSSWSGDESASVIAERIRRARDAPASRPPPAGATAGTVIYATYSTRLNIV